MLRRLQRKLFHGRTKIETYTKKSGLLTYVENEIYIATKVVVETCKVHDFEQNYYIVYLKDNVCGSNIQRDVYLPELELKFKAYISDDRKKLISM